jgi:hypothetical protein
MHCGRAATCPGGLCLQNAALMKDSFQYIGIVRLPTQEIQMPQCVSVSPTSARALHGTPSGAGRSAFRGAVASLPFGGTCCPALTFAAKRLGHTGTGREGGTF